jgi:hypothetical protein
LVVSYIIIVDNIDESLPFLVEELNVTMLKMLMGHREIPVTWWSEIRMDKLHDKKVMDPHGFVVSFDVMSIPRQSDAEIIDAGLLSHIFCKQLT